MTQYEEILKYDFQSRKNDELSFARKPSLESVNAGTGCNCMELTPVNYLCKIEDYGDKSILLDSLISVFEYN